jgi:hypothetical protein
MELHTQTVLEFGLINMEKHAADCENHILSFHGFQEENFAGEFINF